MSTLDDHDRTLATSEKNKLLSASTKAQAMSKQADEELRTTEAALSEAEAARDEFLEAQEKEGARVTMAARAAKDAAAKAAATLVSTVAAMEKVKEESQLGQPRRRVSFGAKAADAMIIYL